MTLPGPPRDYCPHCGASYDPLQEYCLECGARLPTNRGVVGFLSTRWQRRLGWYPGDWIWPVLVLLVVAAIATAAAVAAGSRSGGRKIVVATGAQVTVGPGAPRETVPVASPASTLPSAPQPTISTGPLPVAPGAPVTKRPKAKPTAKPKPKPNPNALAQWPAGKSGYTVVLESIPVSAGQPVARERAHAAKRSGLRSVGVLVSSQYSSLHPGYYVVFSGIYATPQQAQNALAGARTHGFQDAYQLHVTR